MTTYFVDALETMVLGPLLGLSNNNVYSVTILLDKKTSSNKLALIIDNNEVLPSSTQSLHNTNCYSFYVQLNEPETDTQTEYKITLNDKLLLDKSGCTTWTFYRPAKDTLPNIAMASCNGDSKKLPPYELEHYKMWERIWLSHNGCYKDVKVFHALILSGDQVYADPIWKKLDYFDDHNLLAGNSTSNFINHVIPPDKKLGFEVAVSKFYEDLYISSWSVPSIAKILASIPTIMMWDDHDIIDGWGSHNQKLQKCEIFNVIGAKAEKYFSALQIRGSNNKSIYATQDYSQHIRFRNYEIIILDNRKFRTNEEIITDTQLLELQSLNDLPLFDNIPENLSTQKTFIFVVSVPVAHMDFHKITENILMKLFRNKFHKGIHFNDDGLDHWDHQVHEKKQKQLIDIIFDFADKHKPKFVTILSGDVHCAGVARIYRSGSHEKAKLGKRNIINQLITSPISYTPAPKFMRFIYKLFASSKTKIENYKLTIDPFGFQNEGKNRKKVFYQNNYGMLFKGSKGGIQFWLDLEKEEGKLISDPLAKYENSSTGQ